MDSSDPQELPAEVHRAAAEVEAALAAVGFGLPDRAIPRLRRALADLRALGAAPAGPPFDPQELARALLAKEAEEGAEIRLLPLEIDALRSLEPGDLWPWEP